MTCRDFPRSALAFSVAWRSTSNPIAAAYRKMMPRRFIAFCAVSALSCQIGARVVLMSFWSISSTGVLPRRGSTCSCRGVNHRPAFPSPFSSALRAKRLFGDSLKCVSLASSFLTHALSFFDGVFILPNQRPPFVGLVLRLFQRNILQ